MARDLVVDILRQRQRTFSLPLATMADTMPDFDSLFVAESERQTLHVALSRLPEQYRQVIILRYQYQLTLPDIAHQLGRSQEATKATLYRAVLALRKQMQLLSTDPITPMA
ncbi:sigma-70 family RNA polymerase sigma factor [Chloroflexus sp.]|uniref:RNA polymerase sigma factor n=1 Tax=Chloroflexus sp. TaxID=1904827 RepID=UPI002ADE0A37|nr:sigma-70 family RNA polymerase sigma factor [Chloroflexus sp.]